MKLHTATAVLLATLALPSAAVAQDQWGQQPQQVYPAVPVGPETVAYPAPDGYAQPAPYDVSVDLDAGPAVTFETFQQPLGAHGDWITAGSYGTVWRPRVPAGWRPYYYGRWEWTTEGWLWVSDEPFGWATYHYGRWTFDRGAGWIWVPGYQWAPAWVSWRYSGDVVGWAPLAPGLSVYVTSFAFVDFWWTFVPTVSFCSVPVYGVAYGPSYARHYYGATRPAPPRPAYQGSYRPPPGRGAPPAWGGPAPRVVEDRLGRPLHPVRIVPSATPGHGRGRPGEIGVYRPETRPPAQGGGRGPGAAPPPGRGGGLDQGSPRGGGRGTAPVPAPGWEQRGRGPGPAAPPGQGGGQGQGSPRGGGRGTAPVPAPGYDWQGGGGRPSYQPPPSGSGERAKPSERAWSYEASSRAAPQPAAAPVRSSGGGDRGGSSGGRAGGGDRGGSAGGRSGGGDRGGSGDRSGGGRR